MQPQDKRKGQKVIDMDCRGLEFIEFKPDVSDYRVHFLDFPLIPDQGEWEAKGTESSTLFAGIDLSDGEWYDYDEKTSEEVSIKETSWDVGRA